MRKKNWICEALIALDIAALIALNEYVLNLTRGCYNALEILFM